MRGGVALVLTVLLAAALGVASARAGGVGTATTTTGTTTTTTTPVLSYAPLSNSLLPSGCVGAGAAAVVPPSHSVVALGTPASNLGPSGYPTSASVVAFGSSTVTGSTCTATTVTLGSVSLFSGAVTATSVAATGGKGPVSGLEIDGSAVSAAAGQTLAVESWGQLTLGATVGRLSAPLVVRLLQPHYGLLAGTTVAVAFAAGPQPAANPRPKPKHHSAASSQARQTTPPRSHAPGKAASAKKKHRHRQPQKPPPDFPAAPNPFLVGGELADVARDNPVLSIAAQYLGVPYQWGGARPKTGFDCSGLVKYVFAQLGVSLPHYAASQWHTPDGVWVAPNRLQPGDLVFFTGSDGTRKAPGHVGIYAGDGYLIDAPHTGALVRVDRLDERWFANKYVGARRIVSPLHEARHLLHARQPGASPAAFHFGFPSPITIAPAGESLGVAAASAAVGRGPWGGYWIWVGAALGGTLLLLLLAGGVRARRRPLARVLHGALVPTPRSD
jgi:cell wall-associated NlpC family hydrolase